MATLTRRYAVNVAGSLYVDDSCIDCNMCRVTAPENFQRSEVGRHSYVSKQPENEAQRMACLEALEHCPVSAIARAVRRTADETYP